MQAAYEKVVSPECITALALHFAGMDSMVQ